MANFREFIEADWKVINLYNQPVQPTIKEISYKTNRSIGEIYRIIHRYGSPNRTKSNQHNVLTYHNLGLQIDEIAKLTGYTTRNVRYILKEKVNDISQ